VHKYMAVILTELPKATKPEGFEAFLPWNISPAEIDVLYRKLPIF